jgi:hypothetical protein
VHVGMRDRDGQQVGVDRVLACVSAHAWLPNVPMPCSACSAAVTAIGLVFDGATSSKQRAAQSSMQRAASRACIASESAGWRAHAQCSMVHE